MGRIGPAVVVLALAAGAGLGAQSRSRGGAVPPSIAANVQLAFSSYAGGDDLAVERWLSTPQGAANLPYVERILLANQPAWSRSIAAFLIECAAARWRSGPGQGGVLQANPSRGLALLPSARVYVMSRPAALGADPAEDRFEILWHQIAIGIIEGARGFPRLVEYLDHVSPRFDAAAAGGVSLDTRFALARATATAALCCPRSSAETRALPSSAGAVAPPGLEAAVASLERAAAIPSLRVEALIRGGVLYANLLRRGDALAWLERAPADHDDHLLGYVQHLTRGRLLDASNRPADAAGAYASARRHMPSGQLAGIGHAAALLRSGRADEAAETALEARRLPDDQRDLLAEFDRADFRFVHVWLAELRRLRR
jgi:hypothetical protein